MVLEVSGWNDESGDELLYVKIERVATHDDGTADYSVQFAAERCGAVGLHQRAVYGFPRTRYNALALLKIALDTLDPTELELEDGTSESDLARGQRRARRTLPR